MTVLSQNLLTREIFINPADNEQAHALINHIGNILQRSRELIPKDCLSIKNNSCVFYAAELGLNCSDDKGKNFGKMKFMLVTFLCEQVDWKPLLITKIKRAGEMKNQNVIDKTENTSWTNL